VFNSKFKKTTLNYFINNTIIIHTFSTCLLGKERKVWNFLEFGTHAFKKKPAMFVADIFYYIQKCIIIIIKSQTVYNIMSR